MSKKMHLMWFGGTGASPMSTPDAGTNWDGGIGYEQLRPELCMDIARACERARLDAVLFADISVIPESGPDGRDDAVRSGSSAAAPDALPYIGFMGAVTKHIGLGVTVSSTYWPPFVLARHFATYDHLTRGRFAWNIVTQTNVLAAMNYGYDELFEHDLRYDMAQEHLDLVTALWTSWERDALVKDQTTGVYADPAKVHSIDFRGKYYMSRGPLTLPQSPQGRPVIIQAGNSPRGIEFAVGNAEVVITHQTSVAGITAYVDKVRSAASDAGRDPATIKVFSSIKPVMGVSEAAADAVWEQRMAAAPVEQGLNYLGYTLGVDLTTFPLDEPLPEDLEITGIQGKWKAIYPEGLPRRTLREIAKFESLHETLVMRGSYAQIADQMEAVQLETGLDGFHVRASGGYAYCIDFLEHLVPILQYRGLFRREYTGTTLRDHLNEY